MAEKKHWFAFLFQTTCKIEGGERTTTAGVYMGYPDTNLTVARINDAKKSSNMPIHSVMLSVCPLGYMTKEEFTGKPDPADS